MKVINRQNLIDTLSQNHYKNETGMLPIHTTAQQIPVDWYRLNTEKTHLVPGFDILSDKPVSPDSKVVYDLIKNLPVAGIDNLVIQSEFDEDYGHVHEDYNSNGFIFAGLIDIHEDDFFVIKTRFGNEVRPICFRVTAIKRNFIKNTAIIEFDYSFAKSTKEYYDQLNSQVDKVYVCMGNKIGIDSSMIIEDASILTLQDHMQSYANLVDEYKSYFYNQQSGHILYRYTGVRPEFYLWDRVFSSLLVSHRIIYFDPVLTFARKEFGINTRMLVIDIDTSLPQNQVNKCLLNQMILGRSPRTMTSQPVFNSMSPHLAKHQATIMAYSKEWVTAKEDPGKFDMIDLNANYNSIDNTEFSIFQDLMEAKAKDSKIDSSDEDYELKSNILKLWKGEAIDFSNFEIEVKNTLLHFYLIPLILKAYQNFILGISGKSN